MARDRAKPGAAIVQQDAALRRHDACPERGEQRIYERAGVSVAIDGTQVDSVLVLDLGPVRSGPRAVEANRSASTFGARFGQKVDDIDGHMVGIADEIVAHP